LQYIFQYTRCQAAKAILTKTLTEDDWMNAGHVGLAFDLFALPTNGDVVTAANEPGQIQREIIPDRGGEEPVQDSGIAEDVCLWYTKQAVQQASEFDRSRLQGTSPWT
jgi:hypothetical protein